MALNLDAGIDRAHLRLGPRLDRNQIGFGTGGEARLVALMMKDGILQINMADVRYDPRLLLLGNFVDCVDTPQSGIGIGAQH